MVRCVSISLCIASSFNALNRCPAFDGEYYWCSSLVTAEAATLLASRTASATVFNPSTLHTAGLIHNLGLLWLAGNWPEQTSQALKLATEDDSISTLQALRSVIGTDYCEVGGILGHTWKLPEVLVSAMAQHGYDAYPGSIYPSTVLVGYAAELVSALQRGITGRPPFPERTDIHIDPRDLDAIHGKLSRKLHEIRDLAHAMFSA